MTLWKNLMFIGVPYCGFMIVKTRPEPNGNMLYWLLAFIIVFMAACIAKTIHDDNLLKAQNPEYVTTVELAKPLVLIWVIIKFPAILILLIAGILAAKDVWF